MEQKMGGGRLQLDVSVPLSVLIVFIVRRCSSKTIKYSNHFFTLLVFLCRFVAGRVFLFVVRVTTWAIDTGFWEFVLVLYPLCVN